MKLPSDLRASDGVAGQPTSAQADADDKRSKYPQTSELLAVMMATQAGS